MCNTLFINQLRQAAISVVRSGNSLPFIYYVMPLCQVFYTIKSPLRIISPSKKSHMKPNAFLLPLYLLQACKIFLLPFGYSYTTSLSESYIFITLPSKSFLTILFTIHVLLFLFCSVTSLHLQLSGS